LEGDRGRDLRGRLASRKDDEFHSAVAECMACWFLAGRLQLPVDAIAPGRNGKNLDLRVFLDGREVGVEVKAPYRERPRGDFKSFGEVRSLEQCLVAGNKQFRDDTPNILIIVPHLPVPICWTRSQLFTAFYGEKGTWVYPIDRRTGQPAGPTTVDILPTGNFVRRRRPNGASVKISGLPGFTRVSAVIVIEERLRNVCDGSYWIDHDILVAHNPCAHHALSPDLFSGCIQFMNLGKGFGWSDGAPL
jgi:hypothetical protein